MKSARILMLGLGVAILLCMATTGSAVAQEVAQDGESTCWTCFRWNGDGCMYCSADGPIAFADHCSTPRCGRCQLSGMCIFVVMQDGRVSPPELIQPRGSAIPIGTGDPSAVFASASAGTPDHSDWHVTDVSRSCDGGIISKRYPPVAESRIRAATSKLRL